MSLSTQIMEHIKDAMRAKDTVAKIIAETGASGIASMGKVMGIASAQLGGTAEGKTISMIVKKLLV